MEQLEVVTKIKEEERLAKRTIEEARLKASSIIDEAKFTKRDELIQVAQDQASREVARLKEGFKNKIREEKKRIELDTKQRIEDIKKVASKNKDRAKGYIVQQVLKIWQLQG